MVCKIIPFIVIILQRKHYSHNIPACTIRGMRKTPNLALRFCLGYCLMFGVMLFTGRDVTRQTLKAGGNNYVEGVLILPS